MAFSRNVAPGSPSQPRRRSKSPATRRECGSDSGSQLTEKLRTIAAAASAPEEAIDPALRAILEGTGTPAGAVCLYDAHQQILRLVAEVGLSDEGCQSLRNVRGGATTAWDMPLQSLLSRRVYLIENASENRYVPQLVEDPKARYTVACIPLYAGSSAVGSLIVVAITPAVFSERHIQILDQPQRELVSMIEAVRQRAARARKSTSKSASLPDSAKPPSGPEQVETSGSSPVIELTEEQIDTTSPPELTGTNKRGVGNLPLRAQLAKTEASVAPEERARLAALQGNRDELADEVERLRAQLAETEAVTVAREAESRQERAAEVEHLLELLNDAKEGVAQEQRAKEELKAELEGESKRIAEALQQAAQANSHTAAQAAEIEQLRASLDEAQSATANREKELLGTSQAEQEELTAEVARLRASLVEAQSATANREKELLGTSQAEQEELTAEVARLRASLVEAQSAAANREMELLGTSQAEQEELTAEVARLRASLVEAQSAAANREKELLGTSQAEQEELTAEVARLRASLDEAQSAAADREKELLGTSQAEQEELTAEVARLRASLTAAQSAAADRENDLLRTSQVQQEELTAEVARLRASLTAAQSAAADREDDVLGTSQAEHGELTAEVARLRASLDEAQSAAADRENDLLRTSQVQQEEQAAEIERLHAQLAETQSEAANREKELLGTSRVQQEEQAAEIERLRTQLTEATASAASREEGLATELQRKQEELARELEAAAARNRQTSEEQAAALRVEHDRITALNSEIATRDQDHAAEVERLTSCLTDSESARTRETARIGELEKVNAELSEKLEAAAIREDALGSEIGSFKCSVNERAAELEEARERVLLAERAAEEARAETATVKDGLAEAHAHIDEMQRTIAQTEGTAERFEARATEAEDRRTQLERELDVAQAKLREAEACLTASQDAKPDLAAGSSSQTPIPAPEVEVVTTGQPVGLKVDNVKARKMPHRRMSTKSAVVSPNKTDVPTRPATRPAESAPNHFVIIDSEESWSGVDLDKQKVTIVTPGDDQALPPANSFREPILLNLAIPGSLRTLSAFREAGVTTGFQAYIVPPGTGRALKLGMLETTSSPMDPEAILAALEGSIASGTRLLTAAADADAVMSLRQALSRQGVSVSMAWDGSQARDLLTIIRPEVVVIDLDLPPRDGYGLVAELADLNPVPLAVLIPARTEGAARFAAEAGDRSRVARLVTLQQLLGDLLKLSSTA